MSGETPVVDSAKIDAGRNLSEREIKNLPLVSRNPYNFALVQPGVSGFENPEFGVPRFSANGTLLRVNYQIDGNTNTEKDRAGLRLLPVSEVMVQEVKVITSGYAPEFGQTTGMVYNAITPSGTNFVNMEYDHPGPKPSYGVAGYTADGKYAIVNQRYDLWLVPLDGKLLSLAVPMDEWVPSHAPGPLVEPLILQRYRQQMKDLAGGILAPPPTLQAFRAQRKTAMSEPLS